MHGFDFDLFIGTCVELVLDSADLADYQARYLRVERELFPSPAQGNLRDDDDLRRRLGLALARAVWQSTPHPGDGFASPSLPAHARRSPCYCGSGAAYSNCCEPLCRNVPLQDTNLLGMVLQRLPRARWKQLPGSRIDVERVSHTALEWLDQDDDKAVQALLEPWFAADSGFVAKNEMLFDLLLDLYTDLGKPRKKSQLLDRALQHGDNLLKSAALQRLAAIASDKQDFVQARTLFRKAEQLTPEAVSLSHLDVSLLLNEGREKEAKAAARRWMARLYSRRDPALQPLIDQLRVLERDGLGALERLMDADPPASR